MYLNSFAYLLAFICILESGNCTSNGKSAKFRTGSNRKIEAKRKESFSSQKENKKLRKSSTKSNQKHKTDNANESKSLINENSERKKDEISISIFILDEIGEKYEKLELFIPKDANKFPTLAHVFIKAKTDFKLIERSKSRKFKTGFLWLDPTIAVDDGLATSYFMNDSTELLFENLMNEKKSKLQLWESKDGK